MRTDIKGFLVLLAIGLALGFVGWLCASPFGFTATNRPNVPALADTSDLVIFLDARSEVLEATGPDDPAEAGDAVVQWRDQSGIPNDPTSIGSAVFQTGPDRLVLTEDEDQVLYSTRPFSGSDFTAFLVVNTTDTTGILLTGTGTGAYVGVFQDLSTAAVDQSAGTPDYYVDGVLQVAPDRQDLYDVIATGAVVVVAIVGIDGSTTGTSWNSLRICGYPDTGSPFRFAGDLIEARIYNKTLNADEVLQVSNQLQAEHGP